VLLNYTTTAATATQTAVIVAETEGAASFGASLNNANGLQRLSAITTVATSLGALEVTPAVLDYAKQQLTLAEVKC
jgi:threonine dehydratase